MNGVSVYKSLTTESIFKESATVKDRGRSKELLENRNTFLIHRFYFKSKLQKKAYPEVISELSNELHLSVVMVQKIILARSEDVLQLKKQGLTVARLRQLWSCWVWEVKEKPAA